jgi:hypothetical protein
MRPAPALLYRTLNLVVEKAVARGELSTNDILGALEGVKADVLEMYAARDDLELDDDIDAASSDVPLED